MSTNVSVLALAVLLGAWPLGCAPPQTIVESPSAGAPVRGVAVTGIGKAAGPPNIARANLGVEVRAAAADQAVKEVNATMARVIAELKRLGIADKDVRSTNVSIFFEREFEHPPRPLPEAPAPPTIPAPKPGKGAAPGSAASAGAAALPAPAAVPAGFYRATNTVEVTIRDLNRAGDVLGAAAAAGANQMHGISFEIEDPAPLEAQARAKAMADARARGRIGQAGRSAPRKSRFDPGEQRRIHARPRPNDAARRSRSSSGRARRAHHHEQRPGGVRARRRRVTRR